MKRIYHHHKNWEEVKYNMYGSYNPSEKNILIQKVIYYFHQQSQIEKWMEFVIQNFKYSCEHNFTNPNMNKVAWLGQASVSACYKIPEDITRIAWSFLDKHVQDNADKIAEKKIKRWLSFQKNI